MGDTWGSNHDPRNQQLSVIGGLLARLDIWGADVCTSSTTGATQVYSSEYARPEPCPEIRRSKRLQLISGQLVIAPRAKLSRLARPAKPCTPVRFRSAPLPFSLHFALVWGVAGVLRRLGRVPSVSRKRQHVALAELLLELAGVLRTRFVMQVRRLQEHRCSSMSLGKTRSASVVKCARSFRRPSSEARAAMSGTLPAFLPSRHLPGAIRVVPPHVDQAVKEVDVGPLERQQLALP